MSKAHIHDKPDDPRHGTVSGYQYLGCRCDACRKAVAASQRERVRRRKSAPKPEHVHGTLNGYSNYGCRCAACRVVWTAYVARSQQRRKAEPTPDHVHGTPNGYGNYGCRCRPCTDAHNTERLNYYHRNESRAARSGERAAS